MFLSLALVVAAGLVGPLLGLGKKALVPVLVGELLAGAVLGNTGFRIIDPTLNPMPYLYGLGFILLMLGAGTEVDLHSTELKKGLPRGALAMLISFIAAIPLAFVIGVLLHFKIVPLLAVLLAGSSAAVAFPIIIEKKLTGTTVALLISWLALADGLTALLMPLTLTGAGKLPLALAGDLAMLIVAFLVIFMGGYAGRHQRTRYLLSEGIHESKERSWALQLRLSLLFVFVLGAIAAFSGGSMLMAGFAAGITLRYFNESHRLALQISGIANGFLVPLFFVLLGATLDLRSLFSDPSAILLALSMALGSVFVHVISSHVASRADRMASGLLASAQLGLPAAAATLGLSTHMLSPALAAALVLGAVLTLIPATIGSISLAKSLQKSSQ